MTSLVSPSSASINNVYPSFVPRALMEGKTHIVTHQETVLGSDNLPTGANTFKAATVKNVLPNPANPTDTVFNRLKEEGFFPQNAILPVETKTEEPKVLQQIARLISNLFRKPPTRKISPFEFA